MEKKAVVEGLRSIGRSLNPMEFPWSAGFFGGCGAALGGSIDALCGQLPNGDCGDPVLDGMVYGATILYLGIRALQKRGLAGYIDGDHYWIDHPEYTPRSE